MDTRALFQNISKRMLDDFQVTAFMKHGASRGAIRENGLKDFLGSGRLPAKYAIGSGEIVGPVRDTSKQSDLIIYDALNGVRLLDDRSVNVFPIDSVYGIIEVKSSLSKSELLDSLEKIKTFKSMSLTSLLATELGNGIRMIQARSKPFGVVFAYRLKGNSLDSLRRNLVDWERNNSPEVWPNLVCILDSGIIQHNGKGFDEALHSGQINAASWPIGLEYREDTLFKFYSGLHDLCAHMNLGPVELMSYFRPLDRVGKHVITGGLEINKIVGGKRVPGRFREEAIDRIVRWCKERGTVKFEQVLLAQLGTLPEGSEGTFLLKSDVYFYNPDNLPGIHQIKDLEFHRDERGVHSSVKSLLHLLAIQIDHEPFYIASDSLKDEDFEPIN